MENVISKSKTSIKEINFYSESISGYCVKDVTNHTITDKAIVINIGNSIAKLDEYPYNPILPRKSTVLANTRIKSADSLIVIGVNTETNLGGVILDRNWKSAESIFGEDFKNVPLWRSPQETIGETQINSNEFGGAKNSISDFKDYEIKVNLWFATEKTHCCIHNEHNFIEYHTQIRGLGKMQKFRQKSFLSLYEEITMGVGTTHDVFCSIESSNTFKYPWHQYFSFTDCIWLVTELHPK